jgi:hypothetical protein
MEDAICIAKPFDSTIFTVLNNQGRCVQKKYPFAMLAVKVNFTIPFKTLKYLYS